MSILLVELGDKTQLASLLFATNQKLSPFGVFVGASSALVLTSLLAVLFGVQISRLVPFPTLKNIAGAGFVLIGASILIGGCF
jgi:putative Ca2+/H+ antiporter (TMEM165/GDT1 family)